MTDGNVFYIIRSGCVMPNEDGASVTLRVEKIDCKNLSFSHEIKIMASNKIVFFMILLLINLNCYLLFLKRGKNTISTFYVEFKK